VPALLVVVWIGRGGAERGLGGLGGALDLDHGLDLDAGVRRWRAVRDSEGEQMMWKECRRNVTREEGQPDGGSWPEDDF
jgi:hypothetical protein